jgi:hypothetical protein
MKISRTITKKKNEQKQITHKIQHLQGVVDFQPLTQSTSAQISNFVVTLQSMYQIKHSKNTKQSPKNSTRPKIQQNTHQMTSRTRASIFRLLFDFSPSPNPQAPAFPTLFSACKTGVTKWKQCNPFKHKIVATKTNLQRFFF